MLLAHSLVRESLFSGRLRESDLRYRGLRSTESTAMRWGGRPSQVGFDFVDRKTWGSEGLAMSSNSPVTKASLSAYICELQTWCCCLLVVCSTVLESGRPEVEGPH